jgi:hypothetical protein
LAGRGGKSACSFEFPAEPLETGSDAAIDEMIADADDYTTKDTGIDGSRGLDALPKGLADTLSDTFDLLLVELDGGDDLGVGDPGVLIGHAPEGVGDGAGIRGAVLSDEELRQVEGERMDIEHTRRHLFARLDRDAVIGEEGSSLGLGEDESDIVEVGAPLRDRALFEGDLEGRLCVPLASLKISHLR